MTLEPEHETIDNEFRDIRLRFERTLQPKVLTIFRLRHHSSLTFKEIAKELGIRETTAKVQYHRTVKSFRTWLEKHYPDVYRSLIGGGEESDK
jgi:DNA-directed RNA polymerase specialized sigma24 family protein